MTLVIDPDFLFQGASTSIADVVFDTPSSRELAITSSNAQLPTISAGDFFEIRDHSNTVNNGLWKETGGMPSASNITAVKVSGADPAAATSEAITTLGTTAVKKNVFFDCSTSGEKDRE